MKLIDLDAATATRYDRTLVVKFSDDLFTALAPYRANREASGFVRLATGVLLGLVGDGDLGAVADELVVGCRTTEDLRTLTANTKALWRELMAKLEHTTNG